VKFRTTPAFDRDWKRPPDEHKRIFRERLGDFNKACDAFAADKAVVWPAALRVSRLTGTKSIWEMTGRSPVRTGAARSSSSSTKVSCTASGVASATTAST
jgi:hypothetical protein